MASEMPLKSKLVSPKGRLMVFASFIAL